MATVLSKPIVAEPKIEYIVKSKLGYNMYTFGDPERAKAFIRERPDRSLTLIKKTITEEEIPI